VVIAIIAILAAILIPVLAQVRESARATDCLTRLHQIWVSANVYRQDEGDFPGALMGYVESGTLNQSNGSPYDPTVGHGCIAGADAIINGFLYPEQIRDSGIFKCPDNPNNKKRPATCNDTSVVTTAYFPLKPPFWPAGKSYITDAGGPVATNCPSDANGYMDCYLTGPLAGKPKYYYRWDSYDIGPRILADGTAVRDAQGNPIFEVHYSPDWTGVTGATDMPNQLKYSNPPTDKTLLTYCTYHTATAGAPTYTAITLSGTAKKLDRKLFQDYGANVYNQ
jgi:type II secretory pathway pseudopilin PulG